MNVCFFLKKYNKENKYCQWYAIQFAYNLLLIRPLCRAWVCFYWFYHVFPILSVILTKYHYLRNIWNCSKRFMKSVFIYINWPKPGYTSITSSTISNIPYNSIFTKKINDSSILITIISCDYLNLSLADEHVADVTIPTQIIEYVQHFLRWISQSDCSIQIKLNY